MPIPLATTTGDPIFRSQSSSVSAIKRFSRAAADASQKLNSQERLISPGDDALTFSTSRRIRSEIMALKVVSETGQLNITGLNLAVDALETMKVQLDKIKSKLVQAQVADDSERDSIQAEIDLSLAQIDSTAQNTKLGSRSLLNGDATINAFRSISNTGVISDFSVRASGLSVAQTSGVQNVRVNKLGAGGATRLTNNGETILSMRVSVQSANKGTKPFLSFVAGNDAADFAEFRITGKAGTTTFRINSSAGSISQFSGEAMNALALDTGVTFTSGPNGQIGLTTIGFGGDEFIKVELVAGGNSGGGAAIEFSAGGAGSGVSAADSVGTAVTETGTATFAVINGTRVELGGEYGTTARYLANGYDIEIDFATVGLMDTTSSFSSNVNIDLSQGVVGLLGADGRQGDMLNYGYAKMTTETLGRSAQLNTVTVASTGSFLGTGAVNTSFGNEVVGGGSVADLGAGGRLSLNSGNFREALSTIDRAIDQIITEQTRLGTIQGNFIDALNRAEVSIGNLGAADADIIGVDAATEITNLVQSQLGVSTASSVLSQANAMQANVFALLRG